ncbi:MAG: DUF6703 family protein [Chloroflexota bacterium]
MTAHAHDPVHLEANTERGSATVPTVAPAVRPRWLLPVALGAIVVVGLVAGGFLSLSTVLYAGLIGGMLLMHVGGHGQGSRGHGGHGHADGEGGGSGSTSEDLSGGSSNAQQEKAGSVGGFDGRATNETMENGNDDRDRRSSSSCH